MRSYRDLTAWQKSMDLVVDVYRLTARLPNTERFGLIHQMRKASSSAPSNIAEGHGRRGKGEFLQHLGFAIGSLQELETQAIICGRLGFLSEDDVAIILTAATEVCRIITGLIRSINRYRQ